MGLSHNGLDDDAVPGSHHLLHLQSGNKRTGGSEGQTGNAPANKHGDTQKELLPIFIAWTAF